MSIQPNGKNAITHYNVLDEYSNTKGLKFSHIECKLETGRTHQIRVHMASVHHPLLGDQVYGSIKQPYNTQGQTLHAKTLGIIHPTTKKYVEFNSDLPEYFDKLLNNLNKI